jgi:hypothetical protein
MVLEWYAHVVEQLDIFSGTNCVSYLLDANTILDSLHDELAHGILPAQLMFTPARLQ